MSHRTALDSDDAGALYPPTAPPSRRVLPLPLYLGRFIRNPLVALPRAVYDEPIVFYGPPAKASFAWVTDPALVATVLLEDAASFPKTDVDKRIFRPSLGEGILTAEGERWRWQRKLAAPLFRHGEILSYVPAMSAAAAAQLARWRAAAGGAQHLAHVDRDMTATTFDVISHTILAGCDAREGEIIQNALDDMLQPISWEVAYAILRLPEWLWHPGKRRMHRAAADVRAAVGRLAARRRQQGAHGEDILGRLLRAKKPEGGQPMSESELVDNLTTFLAAGHETTAKALTWALYLLARAPVWQQRLRSEAMEAAGHGSLGPQHLERLPLAHRVVKEAMRLYPPAPVLTRVAARTVRLGPHEIRAGLLIVIPIYAIHRHRKLWLDPDRFDPDRFLPAGEAAMARAQFMPFGFGPRTCIGASFALVEAVTLLATLVRGARFAWDGRHAPEPISRVTLRPQGGMPLLVTPL